MRTIWKTGTTCPKGVAKRRYGNQLHSRSRHVAVRADLSDSIGLVVKPEAAAVISTAVAALSAVVGASLAEEKKAKLEKELELERRARLEMTEMASIVARYRGPLLESCVDLEQRLWHTLTRTGEWTPGADSLCFEEISYTMFTLSQLLGFLEVCRREGPRERNFLETGSLGGSDTLFTLLEGIRFIMCASPATLQAWGDEGDDRDHPGARERKFVILRNIEECNPDRYECHVPLRISRGMQRAIGACMVVTPVGAKRHYTMSYSDFALRLKTDANFAAWFQPLEESLADLLTGSSWEGRPPFPCHRWTRVLLLQQLLVEAFDLLDPKALRIMPSRRMRLAPVAYKPLPNLETYQARLCIISNGAPSNLEAIRNLADPLAVARQGGVSFTAATTQSSWLQWPGPGSAPDPGAALANAAGSLFGSPLGSSEASSTDDAAGSEVAGVSGMRQPAGTREGDAGSLDYGVPSTAGGSPAEAAAARGTSCGGGRNSSSTNGADGNGMLVNGARRNSEVGNGGGAELCDQAWPSGKQAVVVQNGQNGQKVDAVLPMSVVLEQMRLLHKRGGADGTVDGEALLQDVIGAPLKQLMQQAQGMLLVGQGEQQQAQQQIPGQQLQEKQVTQQKEQ